MLGVMEKNRINIEKELIAITFHMHGAVSFNDAFMLTMDQRKYMADFLQSHFNSMDPNKKSQL